MVPKNRLMFLIQIFALVSIISGCHWRPMVTRFVVEVDSIRDVSAPDTRNYIILPGKKGVDNNDLHFKEYSEYVMRALDKQGYSSVKKSEEADLAILLDYGIGRPETRYYSYSSPVYGQIAGGTSYFNEQTYNTNTGYSTTTGTATKSPQYGVIGATSQVGSFKTCHRYIIIEAINGTKYKNEGIVIPIWKTTINSSGSSCDLRRAFPNLVAAALSHIGTDTGKQVSVTIKENNDTVKYLKGIAVNSETNNDDNK